MGHVPLGEDSAALMGHRRQQVHRTPVGLNRPAQVLPSTDSPRVTGVFCSGLGWEPACARGGGGARRCRVRPGLTRTSPELRRPVLRFGDSSGDNLRTQGELAGLGYRRAASTV